MGNNFVENTLIKLKREYTRDEVVAALYKTLSNKNIEIGMLKSEKHELEDILLKRAATTKKLRAEVVRYKEANNVLLARLNGL